MSRFFATKPLAFGREGVKPTAMTTRDENFTTAKRIAHRYGISRAFTFWRAALREPQVTHDWIAFVTAHWPESAVDGMVMRPLRPYMRQHFSTSQRRDLLRTHYETMAKYFMPHDALRAEPGMVVATLAGKNEARYTIMFGGNTSKEGEVAFGIYDVDGHYLAKMEGSIGHDENGKPVLWIGGLQGAKPPMGRDDVVKATKDLYGMRPKGAVMLAAQCFAQALQLTAIRAPGNEGHISQRGVNRMRAKRKIYADYGQFWEEIGGVKMDGDEYTLPVVPQVRDVSEVKPHKRSEWKKRQAVSEELATQMRAALAEYRTTPMAVNEPPENSHPANHQGRLLDNERAPDGRSRA